MSPTSFASPTVGLLGRTQDALANAQWTKRLRRATLGRLPFLVLESDVRDIVYANWIVPVTALARFIPPGVTVREVGGHTILTVLTYAHDHFGPALAGPLRRPFPSPLQSNWRLYVNEIAGHPPEQPTVLFLANVFDKALYAIGTRLVSDVMVAHHAQHFDHRCATDIWSSGAHGGGSAPEWALRGRTSQDAILPPAFAPFFSTYAEAIRTVCLQDAAIAPIETAGVLALAGIDLPIDVDTATPLIVTDYTPGRLLEEFGAIDTPFCFRVPNVRFRALSERIIAIAD